MNGSDTRILLAALDGLSLRHKAIASNLANQSTPGFKRVDVRFEDQLARAARGETFEPRIETDRSEGNADGNNVVPENELSLLTRVEITYQLLTRALSMKAAWMRSAASGRSG